MRKLLIFPIILLLMSLLTYAAVPQIDGIIFNSTSGRNLTIENLTAYVTTSDGDSDPVKVIPVWYLDGEQIMLGNIPFEGGSNSTFTKNYAGIVNLSVEGATWNSTGGYDGFGAYHFDGIDDYILADVNGTMVGQSACDYGCTFCSWVKPISPNKIHEVIGRYDISDENRFFRFMVSNMNKSTFQIYTGDGTAFLSAGGNTNVEINSWNFICGWYNGSQDYAGNVRVYLNGQLEKEKSSIQINGTAWGDGESVFIGIIDDSGAPPANWFNGTIDDILVFNRALSDEQILELYHNRTDLIVFQETQLDDLWSMYVTPNDRTSDGAGVFTESILIINLPPAFFSECKISQSPVIGYNRKIPVLCKTNDSDSNKCTISTYANGVLLSTSPETTRIQGIGLVNSFNVNNYLLHGYYDQFMLQSNRTFDIKITCGMHTYNATVVPINKGLIETQGMMLWIKDNVGLIFGLFLFIALMISIALLVLRWMGIVRF